MNQQTFALSLTLQQGYQFTVDFAQEDVSELLVDEAAPLGGGTGPNPARLLGAAVGSCLGASLVHCLRRAQIQPQGLRIEVEGTLARNDHGRLRIGGLRVKLEPSINSEGIERIGRCVEVFEDYCIVTESVRNGIPVEIEVHPRALVEMQHFSLTTSSPTGG